LFFTNTPLDGMGMMQVRIAALYYPNVIAPKAQVQAAERIALVERLYEAPAFDRFPG